MYDTVVTVQGNLASSVTSGHRQDGSAWASFRLASTPRIRKGTEWVDGPTSYFKVWCSKALAENAASCLQSGQPVVVHGRLRVDQWEHDGRRGTEVEVHAQSVGHDLTKGTSLFAKRDRKDGFSSAPPSGQATAQTEQPSDRAPWQQETAA